MSYFSRQKGFTLIELLVVISIVSLLSTIVFASVKVSSSKARDVIRSSEVKQIIRAFNDYYLDHNQYPGTDIGITVASGVNYCLGLKTGQACWEQGNYIDGYHTKDIDGNGYAAAYGDDKLYNALEPYMSFPRDPLITKPNYGDYYLYAPISSLNHTIGWIIETCSPDVIPPSGGAAVSPNTCFGGKIAKFGLWYGQGCQYYCSLNLDQYGVK